MSNFISIIKKELYRFFSDKRMILTTLILPAVLIYMMYSIMGEGISKIEEVDETYKPNVYVCNNPDVFSGENSFEKNCNSAVTYINNDEIEDTKEKIKTKQIDLLLVFSIDFSDSLTSTGLTSTSEIQNIEMYYNSSNDNSYNAYVLYTEYLNAFESSISNVFNINSQGDSPDLASSEDIASNILSTFIPMMVIMILFNSCLSVSAESIAGEKERGTMATLLSTPINRTSLAIGKVVSLSLISLLSGISSFFGVILAMPKILEQDDAQVGMDIYSIADYSAILITIASAVLVIVSIVSVISAYSKSAKEATSMTTPLTVIATLTGMVPLLVDISFESVKWHFIPLFNNVLCMNKILSYSLDWSALFVTVSVNIVVTLAMVFVLSKMFNDEKIIFSK